MKVNYKIFLVILIFGILQSCEEGLNEKPESILAPENFYSTNDEAIMSVNAAYQTNKNNFISGGYGLFALFAASEDCITASAGTFGAYNNNDVSSSEAKLIVWWRDFYATIGRCNITAARVAAANIDEEIKKRVIGEAKFLRALNYFYVVQIWGPAPLKTTIPLSSDDTNLSRSSISDIYKTIINDLKYAEENCWEVNETKKIGGVDYRNDLGRATKGAAKALLAKVYLKIASTSKAASKRTDTPLINSNTGQVDGLEAYKIFPDYNAYYDSCIQKCNEVEALGYALNSDYMANFTTKNGIESIFEIQSHGELGYGSRLAPMFEPGYSGLYGGTWGGVFSISRIFMQNQAPFKVFKNANYDYRPAKEGDNASKVTKFPFNITDYRYKKGFVHSFTNYTNKLSYQFDEGTVRYVVTNGSGVLAALFTSKYIDTKATVTDGNSNNWILLRFSDVLLMKAECLFEKGNWDSAWELIKRVYTRDGHQNVGENNIVPNDYHEWIVRFSGNSEEEQFREAILYERLIEFSFEGHRFFDISRTGKLEEKNLLTNKARNRKSYYLPISQIEINANDAISSLDNNPGYETKQ